MKRNLKEIERLLDLPLVKVHHGVLIEYTTEDGKPDPEWQEKFINQFIEQTKYLWDIDVAYLGDSEPGPNCLFPSWELFFELRSHLYPDHALYTLHCHMDDHHPVIRYHSAKWLEAADWDDEETQMEFIKENYEFNAEDIHRYSKKWTKERLIKLFENWPYDNSICPINICDN